MADNDCKKVTHVDTIKAADKLVTHHTRRFLAISIVVTMEISALAIVATCLKGLWCGDGDPALAREVFLLLFGGASGALTAYGIRRANEANGKGGNE